MKKFTVEEKKFAKMLDGYNFIARDGNDDMLGAYKEKPVKDLEAKEWIDKGSGHAWLPIKIFPEIKWEDEKPTPIRDIIFSETAILTEDERKYLEGVLGKSPIDKVSYIYKDSINRGNEEVICIDLHQNDYEMVLYPFRRGSEYTGMNIYEHYTVEELGLFDKEVNDDRPGER